MHKYIVRTLYIVYGFIALLLLLYSYTQIDLSLTLTQSGFLQSLQKQFQLIGYFNRPLSVVLYVFIATLLFVFYGIALYLAKKSRISIKQAWLMIGIISVVCLFSYSAAFSYDVFNYIFTSKSVLLYKQNPYQVKPLDFDGIDSMLSFMRWTHLPSAYTPTWIVLTLPAYLLSFGSLLLNIWQLKLTVIIFYLLIVWSFKFLKNQNENVAAAMIFFALNPVVILEVLVSGHNDIVMMSFALLGFALWSLKSYYKSLFFLALSVSTKFMTIFLLPLIVIGWTKNRALWLMILSLAIVLTQREFLPWYFLWVIPFGALIHNSKNLLIVTFGISLGLVFRYVPILYNGSYSKEIVNMTNHVVYVSIFLTLILIILNNIFQKRQIMLNKGHKYLK